MQRMRWFVGAGMLLAVGVGSPSATSAARAAGLSLEPAAVEPDAGPAAAVAELDAARTSRQIALTLYFENDGSWARPEGTDRWYTSGEGLSVASEGGWADPIGCALPSFNNEFAPERATYALGFIGSQEIYTPNNYVTPQPDPNDHPYAGWTYGGLFFQRANGKSFEHLELDIGVTGEESLARRAQLMVHDAFGYTKPQGWAYQTPDEVDFDVLYHRVYRWSLWKADDHDWDAGWELQALPDVGLTLGTAHVNAEAGGTLRFGWQLPDDYGPGWLRNLQAFTGLDKDKSWGLYGFAAAHGIIQARNLTVEGDAYHDSPGATLVPQVGDLAVGFSTINWKHVQLTWALHYRTREFNTQPDSHMYGSWSLMFFWNW